MLSLIASGEAIAFIGAGLSRKVGYPIWPDLLKTLHDEANELAKLELGKDVEEDYLRYAQAIKDHCLKHPGGKDRYGRVLGRVFGPTKEGPGCTDTHKLIAQLPFRAFVTTNYEDCVENGIREFVLSDRNRPVSDIQDLTTE